MADSHSTIIYQALFQPMADWTARADERRQALETHRDTFGGKLTHSLFGPADETVTLSTSEEARIEELKARDARHSFVCNARAIAVGPDDPEEFAHQLVDAFADVSHTCYAIEGCVSSGKRAQNVVDAVRDRTVHPPRYGRGRNRLPWRRARSRAIVVDPEEVPNFCVLGGEAMTAAGARAVAPTPGERTALPRPPVEQLSQYRGEGMVLGTPLTQDGTPDSEPLVLPPDLQPLHIAWSGKTGSGKTTAADTAILSNHVATDGADIVIDPKGDGNPIDLLRMHYARHETLDNVIYFDCSKVLPAFSFFDIRDELEAGVSRTTAVEDRVDHYLEMLTQIMGRDRFNQAVRSPDIIRYLVKAMFDPVSGSDAFSHRDLHTAVRRMHERQTEPPVADADLERMLAGVVANRARSFDEIMQGVANRMEKIPVDKRLARTFNHVPEAGDPHFDLADFLDDDVLIIFDTGDLRSEAKRVLTLVILSNLWTALRRRARRTAGDHALVNVYIEEAASVAVSDLLKDLLSQGRGFGCSLTLAMQFPGQLRADSEDVYAEVLNNISTFITGNVPVDRRLADRLATDDMTPQQVGNRLRALRRGQWLLSLPAKFDQPEPRPFLVRSLAPPRGHPANEEQLSSEATEGFHAAFDEVRERTAADVGLELEIPRGVDSDEADDTPQRVDSALPHTTRLPPTVEYRSAAHMLACRTCDARFDADIDGMQQSIECCSSIEETDSDDIPICDLNLKLSPDERAVSDYSDAQLMFLQAVYNAQQLRYDDLEYDLRWDSMIRLQEYVGIDPDSVQDLIDDGLLTKDADRPHRLYSVTPAGRSTINERYRHGIEYGHGKGDLEETSQHVLAVELGRRYLEVLHVDDPESEATQVIAYFDLEERDEPAVPMGLAMGDDNLTEAKDEFDQRRIDVVALDDDGNVVVAMEAERINHDHRRAVPKDFDKMAECNPAEAIWIAMSHSEAHEILAALNDPLEGEPRVEKTYSENSPADRFQFDTPGCTGMFTLEQVRDMLDDRE